MNSVEIHILYRFYDDDGALLYVGRTTNPVKRFKEHSHRQPWWNDVADTRLESFNNSAELAHAERVAITVELPRYNIQLNPIHVQVRRPGWGEGLLRSATRTPAAQEVSHPAPIRMRPKAKRTRRKRLPKQRRARCSICGRPIRNLITGRIYSGECIHRACEPKPLLHNPSRLA